MKNKPKKFWILDQADLVALSICILTFIGWLSALIYKYQHFGYYDWDLALYSQLMWNLVHGSVSPSLFGTNFLTNHAHYFSFLLVPIYALFQSPITLITLKILSHVCGAYVLYLIGKKKINAAAGIIFSLLYLTYPPNIFVMIFEFHFESLALLFLFLMYYFFDEDRYRPFMITAFLLCLIKENMPLIVIAFGIYSLFSKRKNKLLWGAVPILMGGMIFYVSMFVITPHLRQTEGIGSANQYIGMYSSIGTTPQSISQNLLSKPIKFFNALWTAQNLRYLRNLMGPMNIFPLLSPHILFLISPIMLQNMLSSSPQMHMIRFHYSATILPFIFIAALNSLKLLKNNLRPFIYKICLILLIVSCGLNLLSMTEYIHFFTSKWADRLDPIRQHMIKRVGKDTPVIATFEFLDKLANRKDLYTFYNVWKKSTIFTGKPFIVPENIQYALVDFHTPWLWSTDLPKRKTFGAMRDFFLNEPWVVEEALENVVLLKKNGESKTPLVEVSRSPFKNEEKLADLSIEDKFELLSYNISPENNSTPGVLPLRLIWKAHQDVQEHFVMIISLYDQNEQRHYKQQIDIGYTIYPTFFWKKGEYIKERFWLLLPEDLAPGDYTLVATIFDITNDRSVIFTKTREAASGTGYILGSLNIK